MVEDRDENVCCPFLGLVFCVETEGHQHIVCQPKDGITDNPLLDNEHVKKYCIGDSWIFDKCPYYPRHD